MQAITQGTIKHPAGQRFPSRYGGERVNMVVEMPDGSEERIYGSPEELDGYNRGDAIALIRNKKGEWKPVAIESGPKLPKLP
ncbi:hypothetical protein AMR42_04200, partial [Limnothrix sp. PR1529]|uniref:hypothetical protein n=1 Tax=Limnothrix sp. PR1529 TaxID=1704291 RepID=UPI000C487839